MVATAGVGGAHVWGSSRRIVPLKDAGRFLLVTFTMCRECGEYEPDSITAEMRTLTDRRPLR